MFIERSSLRSESFKQALALSEETRLVRKMFQFRRNMLTTTVPDNYSLNSTQHHLLPNSDNQQQVPDTQIKHLTNSNIILKSNRKVCRYSYLFIAPPDLELNKTKRWQWRFFILHDDGELTYSLDENPLTLPQGRINMCKCEEITELNSTSFSSSTSSDESNSLAGYPYSLRLRFATPNKDIYIAAGNYEEISKWRDILLIYCKRPLHKTESSPLKSMTNPANNPNTTSSNKALDLDDFDNIDDIDDLDEADADHHTKKHHIQDDYDCDGYEDDDEPEDHGYEYDENQFATIQSEARKTADFYYNYPGAGTVTKCQSLSSSSSSSSSSNLNRNRNESLKLKMISGIKKSKSKNKLGTGQATNKAVIGEDKTLGNNEEKSLDMNSSNDTSISNEVKEGGNEGQEAQAISDGGRRLSYKEDDLLRKQRLKDNLNQLLIEYKHEEEQQLKKSNKFSSLNNGGGGGKQLGNRMSLDSAYASSSNKISGYNKSSAFSLVVPPHQLMQQQQQNSSKSTNSAFKPINSSTTNKSNNSETSMPIKIQSKPNKNNLKLDNQKQKDSQQNSSSNIETSSSSQSSWTSTSSSSSSSSKSPPKTRATIAIPTDAQSPSNSYKKPCLISPRKPVQQQQTSDNSFGSESNKNLKILVNTNNVEKESSKEGDIEASPQRHHRVSKSSFGTLGGNTCGYLWRESNTKNGPNKTSSVGYNTDDEIFEKFWFSLNASLSCLIFWHDKYEQDLGKFPLGKFELAKCSQVVRDLHDESSLEFRLSFHQGASSILLKATSIDKKIIWCDALKNSVDQVSSICGKCKPKLIVNPMPLQGGVVANNVLTNSPQHMQQNVVPGSGQIMTSPTQSSSEYFQQQEQQKEANYFKQTIKNQFQQLNQSKQKQPIQNKQQTKQTDCGLATNNGSSDLTESSSSSSPSTLNSTSSMSGPPTPTSHLSKQSNSLIDLDTLRIKHDKLQKENSESQRKFKLLEQIHLDAVNEFDKQQNLMYNQLEEMTQKYSASERSHETLSKKLKERQESSSEQIRILNEQICMYKDKCKQQDSEIDVLNKKIDGFTATFSQIESSANGSDSPVSTGWNKEVKNLDARISDVLGKLRDREMNLCGKAELELKAQLQEAQAKIAQLSGQLMQQQQQQQVQDNRPQMILQDFGDDLAKVLMSKEEVITQLEKQLKDKEKQIQTLTDQLNEEISASNKCQAALDTEQERTSMLTSDLRCQTNQQDTYNSQIDSLRTRLAQTTTEMSTIQTKLTNTIEENENLAAEAKQTAEFNRNELETHQEEIKTLEYKLVHSQRQAHDYQSILEDMDLATTNTSNFLQQIAAGNSQVNPLVGEQDIPPSTSNSIQTKLKRNQFQMQSQLQQILFKKSEEINQLSAALDKTQQELNEVKEENLDLNDHIYSIDVFMREKDQQCDQYQKEKEDISQELQTKLIELEKFNQMANPNERSIVNNQNLRQLKSTLKKLIDFVSSSELMQFNSQIVSYMAEQLVHRSALNGNLKFACDVLRKKYNTCPNHHQDQNSSNNSLLIECKNLQLSPNGVSSMNNGPDIENMTYLPSVGNVQDEKIFRLASELLLSDESSLRKLSSQVLNEAQHLAQLNCILNTLRKIRWKHLKLKTKEKIDVAMQGVESLHSDGSDSEGSDCEDSNSCHGEENGVEEKLDHILNVIKDVFIEHKIQVSEQLTEMQKIMSISAEDEILTHLQNENSILQQELQKYQTKSLNSDKKLSSNSNWLTGNTNLTSSMFSSTSSSSLRKFNSGNLGVLGNQNLKASPIDKKNQHILTDIQGQDDTVC